MAELDCYFWIDYQIPEEDRCMSVMCVKCHQEKMPDAGWFYPGSKEGYGPFDYICQLCGTIIHKAEDENNDKNP